MAGEEQVFTVQYPYDAQLPDELSIRPGDRIVVENWDSGEHWTCGKLLSTGQCGKVYKGFLKIGEEKEGEHISHSTSELQHDSEFLSNRPMAAFRGKHYMLEETPQDWLQCIVCRELACNPQQTLCCGQTLCYECTDKWSKQSNSCPHCRSEPFEVVADPRSERYIAGLTSFCPNVSIGCKWRGSLKKVEKHMKTECPCENVHCTKCDKLMLRKKIPTHSENECELREVSCPCCGSLDSCVTMSHVGEALFCNSDSSATRLTFADLVNRHYKECPQWPARCPNSESCNMGVSFTFSSLAEHLNNDCPHALVSCQFAAVGCDCLVLRKDLPQHLTEALMTHMQLLLVDNARVKVTVSNLTAKVKKLHHKNRYLKSLVYWHKPEKKSRKPPSLHTSKLLYKPRHAAA